MGGAKRDPSSWPIMIDGYRKGGGRDAHAASRDSPARPAKARRAAYERTSPIPAPRGARSEIEAIAYDVMQRDGNPTHQPGPHSARPRSERPNAIFAAESSASAFSSLRTSATGICAVRSQIRLDLRGPPIPTPQPAAHALRPS